MGRLLGLSVCLLWSCVSASPQQQTGNQLLTFRAYEDLVDHSMHAGGMYALEPTESGTFSQHLVGQLKHPLHSFLGDNVYILGAAVHPSGDGIITLVIHDGAHHSRFLVEVDPNHSMVYSIISIFHLGNRFSPYDVAFDAAGGMYAISDHEDTYEGLFEWDPELHGLTLLCRFDFQDVDISLDTKKHTLSSYGSHRFVVLGVQTSSGQTKHIWIDTSVAHSQPRGSICPQFISGPYDASGASSIVETRSHRHHSYVWGEKTLASVSYDDPIEQDTSDATSASVEPVKARSADFERVGLLWYPNPVFKGAYEPAAIHGDSPDVATPPKPVIDPARSLESVQTAESVSVPTSSSVTKTAPPDISGYNVPSTSPLPAGEAETASDGIAPYVAAGIGVVGGIVGVVVAFTVYQKRSKAAQSRIPKGPRTPKAMVMYDQGLGIRQVSAGGGVSEAHRSRPTYVDPEETQKTSSRPTSSRSKSRGVDRERERSRDRRSTSDRRERSRSRQSQSGSSRSHHSSRRSRSRTRDMYTHDGDELV